PGSVGAERRADERALTGRERAQIPRAHPDRTPVADRPPPGAHVELAGQRLALPLQGLIGARTASPPLLIYKRCFQNLKGPGGRPTCRSWRQSSWPSPASIPAGTNEPRPS